MRKFYALFMFSIFVKVSFAQSNFVFLANNSTICAYPERTIPHQVHLGNFLLKQKESKSHQSILLNERLPFNNINVSSLKMPEKQNSGKIAGLVIGIAAGFAIGYIVGVGNYDPNGFTIPPELFAAGSSLSFGGIGLGIGAGIDHSQNKKLDIK